MTMGKSAVVYCMGTKEDFLSSDSMRERLSTYIDDFCTQLAETDDKNVFISFETSNREIFKD